MTPAFFFSLFLSMTVVSLVRLTLVVFGNVVKRCLLFCESREILTMSAYTSDHDTKICQCDFKRDEQHVNVFAVFVLQRAAVIKDPSGALNDKILPRC